MNIKDSFCLSRHLLPAITFTQHNKTGNVYVITNIQSFTSQFLESSVPWEKTSIFLVRWDLTFKEILITTQLDKCLKFMAFQGVIFYREQSFLSPRIDLKFRPLFSCDTLNRIRFHYVSTGFKYLLSDMCSVQYQSIVLLFQFFQSAFKVLTAY